MERPDLHPEEMLDLPEVDKAREKCGIVGIYGDMPDIARRTYEALYQLQHRGQHAAGISVLGPDTIMTTKEKGKVSEVFAQGNLEGLPEGRIGVGHVLYRTAQVEGKQPIYHDIQKFVLAHNGNINSFDGSPFTPNGKSDSARLTDLIAKELAGQAERNLSMAVANTLQRVEGAFSLIIADEDHLIAVRDPYGFRPLVYGQMANGAYVAASESVALDALKIPSYKSLGAGEMLVIDNSGAELVSYSPQERRGAFCLMELVYFSRRDSMYGQRSVSTMRIRSGAELAKEAPADVDVVVGVAGTGLDAAKGYAEQLGLPYFESGIHKTGYERGFIGDKEEERRQIAERKYNVTRDMVEGKRVAVIDDSLIRSTVAGVIVEKLRFFGATAVHFRVASPPYRFPCHYGLDTSRVDELIARHMNETEIADYVDADSLRYLSLNGLLQAFSFIEERLCDACLTGNYPSPVPVQIGSVALRH